jgi:hypothetical protein
VIVHQLKRENRRSTKKIFYSFSFLIKHKNLG